MDLFNAFLILYCVGFFAVAIMLIDHAARNNSGNLDKRDLMVVVFWPIFITLAIAHIVAWKIAKKREREL